jgi:hypothetical protein
MAFRTALVLTALLFTTAASAFQSEVNGVIYGVVVGVDGQPISQIAVEAFPTKNPWSGSLPHAKTDSMGRYRIERLPLGEYNVWAYDQQAGHPYSNWDFYYGKDLPKAQITGDHPNVELRVDLPAPAGFLELHLSNARTGENIRAMRAALRWANNPHRLLRITGYTDRAILLPPEEDIEVHLSSDGFGASDQTIRLHPGDRVILNLQLEPVQK